ncbi:MAG: acyltransferase [Bacteroidales bacterium]|nr:acyltransferase [Bacteroidales bacterium]
MTQFENTRPYNDQEIPSAVARVAASPFFGNIVQYLFPNQDTENIRKEFLKIKTVKEFQQKFMLQALNSILRQTSKGLQYEGFEHLDSEHNYMFIANHRDILLDAALLQVILDKHQLDTSEITFGSNLMQGGLVIDIGKMNKMFRIVRGGSVHDFYRNSLEVSSYMRYAILEKHQSVWIAQRNGRTKNGDDHTEIAVLKMFSISSDKQFIDNMAELNITPIVTSYEYEPCAFLKTQELYISQYQQYIKEAGEDLNSIVLGIIQPKGGICVCATPTITAEELQYCDGFDKNDKFAHLAQIIDQRVYSHYKLWKNNYIAYDLIENGDKYAQEYTPEEKKAFEEYMNEGLKSLVGEADELKSIFLNIYANPVRNREQMTPQAQN